MGLKGYISSMTSQPPRRERALSDKPQMATGPPQRPGLAGRTFSAPAGGLYRLDSIRTTTDNGSKAGRTVIEEEETPTSPGGNGVLSTSRAGDTMSKPTFPHVTIAVVGHDQAGKTTFIRSALDMKHAPTSRSTTKKMSLDGHVYIVRLLEIEANEISVASDGAVQWPRLGHDTPPSIDGVLVIHDVTQPASLSGLTGLLDSLAESTFPFVLVASKCDVQSSDGPCEPVLGNYEIHRTSPDSPRSQKMCIALVLRSVIGNKYDLVEPSYNAPAPPAGPYHHARAFSENPTSAFAGAAGGPIPGTSDSGVDGNGVDRAPTDPTTASTLASTSLGSRYARSHSNPMRPQTPPTGSRLNPRRPSAGGESSPAKDHNRQHRMHTAWRNSGGSDAFNSFLDMEDDMDGPRSEPASPSSKDKAPSEESSNETGFTFDELVDRLVALPMSKQDSKFASIFLCLYRKFAAPSTLLNALINRFERNERNTADQLIRIADQLRLLNVMAQWVSEYPGDLAYPKTRKRITDFVSTLEKSHFYMFAAKEVGSYLDVNAEDDDVGWAFRDGDVDTFDGQETSFFDTSGRSSPSVALGVSVSGEDHGEEEEEDPIYNMNALDLTEGLADSNARIGPASGPDRPGTLLSQSFTCLSLDAAQREAQTLELSPRMPLTKMQWRQFMEIPDEDFARELTRIDWIMFNSFRPRDLVRHVSISGPDKDKIESLKHVNRMIKQFNHLAFFVASVILFRDKPKHRAKALEKFMSIAQKLRRLNNYNALGAVIAGINGTPVHRLSQTRDLLPVQIQKDFMRLVILMGTQKSHFAYRLAWDNSFAERIPFLPLHRRDLVSAEEGNKTFIGDTRTRINWRKFEVMGEVVLGIQHSQKTAYPQMHRYEEAARLILDMKFSGNDEDLYARSMQVEPSTGADSGRRKFGWLRS